jgi:hypothetical protein
MARELVTDELFVVPALGSSEVGSVDILEV